MPTALALLGADCALVALSSPEGVRGAAHAGWRGLAAGVIEETVSEMRRAGAGEIEAVTSPAIHPECYAFSPSDLDALVALLGEEVRGHTAGGEPALDLPRGVAGALRRAGVRDLGALAGCEPGWFLAGRARRGGTHARGPPPGVATEELFARSARLPGRHGVVVGRRRAATPRRSSRTWRSCAGGSPAPPPNPTRCGSSR